MERRCSFSQGLIPDWCTHVKGGFDIDQGFVLKDLLDKIFSKPSSYFFNVNVHDEKRSMIDYVIMYLPFRQP